jgi:hypothetical protein
MRILVCDDRNPDEIVEAIRSGAPDQFEVQSFTGNRLTSEIADFFAKGENAGVTPFLKRKAVDRDAAQLSSGFDGFDLMVLDNNLAELSFGGLPITAEAIAGFVRAFSDTPYVVSLNKNPAVDFDLKYLVGDFESKADLALNTEHLQSPLLWGSNEAADYPFAPWYWPDLSSTSARRREQIEFVLAHMDDPILSSLGFPKSAVERLSRRAIAFLSSSAAQPGNATGAKAKPVSRVTFWNHFQNSGRSLPVDDRASIAFPDVKSDSAKRNRLITASKSPDDLLTRRIIARLVAGELDYWFRRDVLAAQDVLVDAPHLKAKIGLVPDDQDGADGSITAVDAPFGIEQSVHDALLVDRAFATPCWIGRPAFWWSEIEGTKELDKVRNEHPSDAVWVFCEDTRKFLERKGPDPRGVSFVPDGGKPWAPLFVERLQNKGYMPASQFAA